MAAVAENKNILVADDEPKIRGAVAAFLQSRGYTAFAAETGRQALDVFDKNNIALILLDLMLPDLSGEEVCAAVRKKSRVPIIMLTAKTSEASHLNGLALGADDYITKPFSLKVMVAHAEALLRRAAGDLTPLPAKNSWRGGDLTADFEKGLILRRGVPVNLTATEMKILSALIKYPGKIFAREELLTLVLGDDSGSADRVIDNHVKNLRQKIEDDSKSPVYVLTIRGLGYKFGGE
ncbi:MAG: response regulator transcription factor [Oscillospiraceae bacterium]|jgi:DNA-binding response OmpR family regulator|nr:response regulator transcription factor [Oscillospiraceae bacterium]